MFHARHSRFQGERCQCANVLPLFIIRSSTLITSVHEGEEPGQRLASQHTGKDRARFFDHGTGDIQMRDSTETVGADGIDQEPLFF